MQTLVRAYGKMSSAQKVTLENVNMMIDAGFNPLNQICEATGESMAGLYKRISDGKVGFEELQAAVEAVNYYGGMVAGLSAIFATTHECMGYEVTSIFDPSSLPDYASFDSRDCPMCKAGQHIDALVNSFGYSAL